MVAGTLQYRMQSPQMTQPLVLLLHELADVIEQLTDEQYGQKPVGVIPSCIGGHVRHCLDHVTALLSAVQVGQLDYENRARGTAIESSRFSALDAIAEMSRELSELSPEVIDIPVQLSVMMCSEGPKLLVSTSIGRELSYVLSHTIHHNALIGTMVKTLGGYVPQQFGYAPSTVAHQRERACAR